MPELNLYSLLEIKNEGLRADWRYRFSFNKKQQKIEEDLLVKSGYPGRRLYLESLGGFLSSSERGPLELNINNSSTGLQKLEEVLPDLRKKQQVLNERLLLEKKRKNAVKKSHPNEPGPLGWIGYQLMRRVSESLAERFDPVAVSSDRLARTEAELKGVNIALTPMESSLKQTRKALKKLREDRDSMDLVWLFEDSNRVVFCAWDLFKDDEQAREILFRHYAKKLKKDEQEVVPEMQTKFNAIIAFQNLPPEERSKSVAVVPRKRDEPKRFVPSEQPRSPLAENKLEAEKQTLMIVVLNGKSHEVSSPRELQNFLDKSREYRMLVAKDVFDKVTKFSQRPPDQLRQLKRVSEGPYQGSYDVGLGTTWRLYIENDNGKISVAIIKVIKEARQE
ncbi:hypothetical protein HYT18_04195 [Candidatus Microgenomates bacterium]|nr:hypothetical protein [Candidatus Microgenomates bacterium]